MNLKHSRQPVIYLSLFCLLFSLATASSSVHAQAALTVADQTPEEPLATPGRDDSAPRYLSTIGTGDSFTVFYEDRANASRIALVSTTGGPTAFPADDTDTNITDTHMLVKDWPIIVGATEYAYRAWGSVGNNPDHHFYVSNDLVSWTLVSTFTIPNAAGFTDARGWVYYGFHDVIEINGTYYAFAEANSGETMIVRSAAGDDAWEAFDKVGGDNAADGPLQYTEAWTPTGTFFEMEDGYGKLHMPGDDSGIFIAVNRAAIPGMPEDELEAAFINPDNWTWEDGTTGIPTTPLLAATAEHDYRECRLVPRASASDPALIMYTADYGSADGGTSLGYATLVFPEEPSQPPAISDPAVAKHGSPDQAAAGEIVTWTIDIWNPGGVNTNPITLRDEIPPVFSIISAAASSGVVTVSGQLVTVAVGALAPGQRVEVVIQTVVSEAAEMVEACNSAILNDDAALSSRDCVMISPGTLPDAGGGPGETWFDRLLLWLRGLF